MTTTRRTFLTLSLTLVIVAVFAGHAQDPPVPPEPDRILLIGSLSNRPQTTANPYGLADQWLDPDPQWVADLVPDDWTGMVLWICPAGRLNGDVWGFSHNPCTLGQQRFDILRALAIARPEITWGLYIGTEPQEPCSLARRPWRNSTEAPSYNDSRAWVEANLRPWLGSMSTVCWDAGAAAHHISWAGTTAAWLASNYGWSTGVEAIPRHPITGVAHWDAIPPGGYTLCTVTFARNRILISGGGIRVGWVVPPEYYGRVHVLVTPQDGITAQEWDALEGAGYLIGYRNAIVVRPGA